MFDAASGQASGAPGATARREWYHSRQCLVVHRDEFGGVLRRGEAVGHDHRDDVADMAHLVGRIADNAGG